MEPQYSDAETEELLMSIAEMVATRYKYKTPIEFEELKNIAYLGALKGLPRWDRIHPRFLVVRARGAIVSFIRREVAIMFGLPKIWKKLQEERVLTVRVRGKRYRVVGVGAEGSEEELTLEETLASSAASPEILCMASRVYHAATASNCDIEDWDKPAYDIETDLAGRIRYQMLEDQRALLAQEEAKKRSHFQPHHDADRIVATLLRKAEKRTN